MTLSSRIVLAATMAVVAPISGWAQDHSSMDHSAMHGQAGMESDLPTEQGQAAFAAIEEIVNSLAADPDTDWSKVNIAALREHLRDMDAVFSGAEVFAANTADGAIFRVTGDAAVAESIGRMAHAHAMVMAGDWIFKVTDIDNGVEMTVTSDMGDAAKIRALGFFGIMALGGHHQQHHLMIAVGADPHE